MQRTYKYQQYELYEGTILKPGVEYNGIGFIQPDGPLPGIEVLDYRFCGTNNSINYKHELGFYLYGRFKHNTTNNGKRIKISTINRDGVAICNVRFVIRSNVSSLYKAECTVEHNFRRLLI